MTDIIRLLPDSVANQIAAGEVIQRPASAVKEMLENAVDAGSTSIKLIVKDAGKTLIQVIDNGCGMSETDARMSFERHATSKIQKAEDLFAIRTKGFRGEALASVAAVAQVELKTRRTEDELGTVIQIEGSAVIRQEVVSTSPGTSLSVKNLFYNIPARRNFLKSNPVETRHILEEFQRVALAHPDIAFQFQHNGLDVHSFSAGTLRQRIVSVFGSNYNENLVPVSEETTILNISGFIGKPEIARKTRGEQYFFVNQRFIRDPYLHHAVTNAYEQLLPQGSFASYFIFIDINPSKIDINIHPTKTEIKFEDEKSVYAIVRSAVKHSLGQFSISPSLDFEQETSIHIPHRSGNSPLPPIPSIKINKAYNPFESAINIQDRDRKSAWDKHFENRSGPDSVPLPSFEQEFIKDESKKFTEKSILLQLYRKYIFVKLDDEFVIIDQQAAHERILYEKNILSLTNNQHVSQQDLFPQTLEVSPDNAILLRELNNEINMLGFDLREFGNHTFAIHGIPSELKGSDVKEVLDGLLEQYKHFSSELKLDKKENLARTLAKNLSVKPGTSLTETEMNSIVTRLFECQMNNFSPAGRPVFVKFSETELDRLFRKSN